MATAVQSHDLARAAAPRPSGPSLRGERTATAFLGGWAMLLAVQVEGPIGMRLAPSDLLLAAYLLWRLPSMRRVPRGWTGWHAGVVVVVWGGLGVAFVRTGSVDLQTVVGKAIGLLILLLAYAAVLDHVTDWSRLRRLLSFFVVGAAASAALSLAVFGLDLLSGPSVPLVNEPFRTSRLSGLLIDPNAFGGLLATALLLHRVTARTDSRLVPARWSRLVDIALTATLVLTFSRSAWIGTVFGLLAVLAVGSAWLRRAVGPLLVPMLVGLPLLFATLPGAERLVSRSDQVDARLTIAGGAFTDTVAHPVVGIGLGEYGQQYGVIVHNTVLWFLVEMGVVGLVVLVGFLAAHARRAADAIATADRGRRPLAVALFAGLFVGLGVSVGIEAFYQRYWWLMFAAISAQRLLARGRTA